MHTASPKAGVRKAPRGGAEMVDVTVGPALVPERAQRIPTSTLLAQLKRDVPESQVTFGWLVDYLRTRSPEVLILFLALVGVLPGVSLPVGILIAMLAVTMLSTSTRHALPAFIASQCLPSSRLVQTIDRTVPLFRWSERFIRPRQTFLAEIPRPFAGVTILLLGLTLLVPIPFSNVIPSFAIALIAFACIEGDGLLLSVSMMAALLSLAITSAAIWAAIGAVAWVWA